MLLTDALGHAIDYIRANSEDVTLLRAAKAMERKLQKSRARQMVLPLDAHWCECGEVKPANQAACSACYQLIPFAVLADRITGNLRERRRAEHQIALICQARAMAGERMAA